MCVCMLRICSMYHQMKIFTENAEPDCPVDLSFDLNSETKIGFFYHKTPAQKYIFIPWTTFLLPDVSTLIKSSDLA